MSFWAGFEKRANYITRSLRKAGLNTPPIRKEVAAKIRDIRTKSKSGTGDPRFEQLWSDRRKHIQQGNYRSADKITETMAKDYPKGRDLGFPHNFWNDVGISRPGSKGFDVRIQSSGLPTSIYPNHRGSTGNPKAAYKAFKKGKVKT